MVVLDTFGPKCRDRHFDTFSRHSRDASPCFMFAVLSDGNAGSIPAWDIYYYISVDRTLFERYGTVPYSEWVIFTLINTKGQNI